MRLPDLSAVLIYPNTRDLALASLGFLKVREMLSERLGVVDHAYWPGPHGDPVLSPSKQLLIGERTRIEVGRFHIVAFSVSYENDFAHLPELLLQAGLPAMASARSGPFPLVVGGGFAMSVNPLAVADFLDAIVVGEAEPVLDRLLEAIDQARARELSKEALLEMLGAIEGLYVPSLGEREVSRVWSPVDSIAPDPLEQAPSHFGKMRLIEIGRGCGRGCFFCAAGSLYRPVRMRPTAEVLRSAGAGGAGRVGLVGTAVGDHPGLVEMLSALAGAGREIGLGSFRADEVTCEVAGLLARCGVRTVTLAPEAGSDALRAGIGKTISEDQLAGAVEMLAGAGIRIIKLYFMIGLPGETDQDAEAIVALVRRLAGRRSKARLSVAVSPFVPKPHTVLQWAGFVDRETFRRRVAIARPIAGIRGCSLVVGSYREAWVEAVLSRGGRSLGRLLLEAAERRLPLRMVLKNRDLPDVCAELDTQEPLPWDFIRSGAPRKGLRSRYLTTKGGAGS
jgi:radical SAM superfamily enzyme YgiQ (UPF0313 family)